MISTLWIGFLLLCNYAIICYFDSLVYSATVLPSSLLTHASSSSLHPPLKNLEILLSSSLVSHCPVVEAVAYFDVALLVSAVLDLVELDAAVAVAQLDDDEDGAAAA